MKIKQSVLFLLCCATLGVLKAPQNRYNEKSKKSPKDKSLSNVVFSLKIDGRQLLEKSKHQFDFFHEDAPYNPHYNKKELYKSVSNILKLYAQALENSQESGQNFENYIHKLTNILISRNKIYKNGQEHRVFSRSSLHYKRLLSENLFSRQEKNIIHIHTLPDIKPSALMKKLISLEKKDRKFLMVLGYLLEDTFNLKSKKISSEQSQEYKFLRNIKDLKNGQHSLLGSIENETIRNLLICKGPWKLYDEGPIISVEEKIFTEYGSEEHHSEKEKSEKKSDGEKSDKSDGEKSDKSDDKSEKSKSSGNHSNSSGDHPSCVVTITLPKKKVIVNINGADVDCRDGSSDNGGVLNFCDADGINVASGIIRLSGKVSVFCQGKPLQLLSPGILDICGYTCSILDTCLTKGSLNCNNVVVYGSVLPSSQGLLVTNPSDSPSSCTISGCFTVSRNICLTAGANNCLVKLLSGFTLDPNGQRVVCNNTNDNSLISCSSLISIEGCVRAGPRDMCIDNTPRDNRQNGKCKIKGHFLSDGPVCLLPANNDGKNITLQDCEVNLNNCRINGALKLNNDCEISSCGKIITILDDIKIQCNNNTVCFQGPAEICSPDVVVCKDPIRIRCAKPVVLDGDLSIQCNGKIITALDDMKFCGNKIILLDECAVMPKKCITLLDHCQVKPCDFTLSILSPGCVVAHDKLCLKSNNNCVELLDDLHVVPKGQKISACDDLVLTTNGHCLKLSDGCPLIFGPGLTCVSAPPSTQIHLNTHLAVHCNNYLINALDNLLIFMNNQKVILQSDGCLDLNGKCLSVCDESTDKKGLIRCDEYLPVVGKISTKKDGLCILSNSFPVNIGGTNITTGQDSVICAGSNTTVKGCIKLDPSSCVVGPQCLSDKSGPITTNGYPVVLVDSSKVCIQNKICLKTNGNSLFLEDLCFLGGDSCLIPSNDGITCLSGGASCKTVVICDDKIKIDSNGKRVGIKDCAKDSKGCFTLSGTDNACVENTSAGSLCLTGPLSSYTCPRGNKTVLRCFDDTAVFVMEGCNTLEGTSEGCVVVAPGSCLKAHSGKSPNKKDGVLHVEKNKILHLATCSKDNDDTKDIGIVVALPYPGCEKYAKINLDLSRCVEMNII